MSVPALAQTEQGEESELAAAEAEDSSSPLGERSPWLLLPIFNSNPKLGTSLGLLGGYLHYFDEK